MPANSGLLDDDSMRLSADERSVLERVEEGLASSDDPVVQQAWHLVATKRRDEIRDGIVAAIPGPEGLATVRSLVGQ